MSLGTFTSKNSTIVRPFDRLFRRDQMIRAIIAKAGRIAPVLTELWLERQFLTPTRYPWPEIEQSWLRSATVGRLDKADMRRDDLVDGPIRVYRWGEAKNGRIAMLHGWCGRATQFHRFIAAFTAAGYEVLAIDAPGHGGSAGRQSSVFHFLNGLEALIWQFGPVEAVIGHSMGGGVALYALANGLAAKKAILIAPNADLALYSRVFAKQLGLGEAQRASLQARIEFRFGVSWQSITRLLHAPGIETPGLVIHDRDDREIPFALGRGLQRGWSGAKMLATAGLGHRRILADPAVVAASLDFVRG